MMMTIVLLRSLEKSDYEYTKIESKFQEFVFSAEPCNARKLSQKNQNYSNFAR